MRTLVLLAVAGAAVALMAPAGRSDAAPSGAITAAVADPGRPATDVARDANRKPADVLAFAGVHPGQRVGELLPVGGYYSRLLSRVVGPTGHVYGVMPEGFVKARPQILDGLKGIGDNYTVVTSPNGAPAGLEKLDLVWTSENYHDFHNAPPGAPPADMAAFNKVVFDSLRPGGIYLIEDHAAAAGAGVTTTSTLHRIDPAAVKAEVEAAGFKLVGESDVLKNPADTHALPVFDASIRGHTDKLLLKFKKPG
jgi:predicted methyltransferase